MNAFMAYRVRPRSSFRRPPSASRLRGFTLLECLAATAMFAVLMGAMYSVFHGALRLRENAYETFEADLPRDYVVAMIKNDLASTVAPVGLLAGAMIGEKQEMGGFHLDRLEIHTASGTVNDADPWGDIQNVQYYLEQPQDPTQQTNANSYDLVRAVTRNLLASTEEEPQQERLLRGVRGLEFLYYDGEDWQDSWDSTTQENETPSAVSVRIDFLPAQLGERATAPIHIVVPLVTKAVQTEQEQDGETTGADGGAPPGGGGSQNPGGPNQPGGPTGQGGGR